VVDTVTDRAGVKDTVRVRVQDKDAGGGAADTVMVTVVNGSVPPDTEWVKLPRVAPQDSFIYEGRIPTDEGAVAVIGNGVLELDTQGKDLDTLAIQYMDLLTTTGPTMLVHNTYVINMFGDVSGTIPARVGAYDAHKVLAFAVGNDTATFRDSLAGDIDGNNEMLAWDAAQILRYTVKLIHTFPVHFDTLFVTPGDSVKNHPFLKAIGGDIIGFGKAMGQSDGTYLVPITLEERDGILSGTLRFALDPGMEVVDVTTAQGYGEYILAYNAQPEELRVAFAGAQSAALGSGEVLWIRVRVPEGAPLRFGMDAVALNGFHLSLVNAEMLELETVELPMAYALHQNVPNPFNPQTVVRYDLPEEGRVTLVVYNVMGQTVRTLVSGPQVAGRHAVVWDGRDALGRDVASGMYVMRMQAGSFADTRKMLLLR
jgi:hypothetical protein